MVVSDTGIVESYFFGGEKSMAIISLFPEVAFVRVLVWNTKVPESFDLFKVSQGADVVLMVSIVCLRRRLQNRC